MTLKAVLDKAGLEGLEEPLRGLYVEKDGKFVLGVEGEIPGFVSAAELAEANSKVAEFRTNNIELKKKVETLEPVATEFTTFKQRYDGIDPDEHRKLKEQAEKLTKKGVTSAEDLETQLQTAIQAALKPVSDQLAAVNGELADAKRQSAAQARALTEKEFESQIVTVAIKAGVDEKMMPHFLRHVTSTYQLEDGKWVPKRDGALLISRKNGRDPMPLDEFVEAAQTESPGFFKPSTGSGAPPRPGSAPAPRAGVKTLVNPTPQELGRYAKEIAKGEVVIGSSAS